MFTRTIAAIALGFFLAVPATAQDVVGTINGTIDDQTASWNVLSGDPQSPGVWIGMGPGMDMVTFFADPAEAAGRGMLNLSFGVMQAGSTMQVFNAGGYFRDSATGTGYSAPMDEGIMISPTSIEKVAGGLQVQGSFSGDFYLVTDATTGAVDKGQMIRISGDFDTLVPPN